MDQPTIIQSLNSTDVQGAYLVFERSITQAFNQEGLGSLQDDIKDEIEHKKSLLQSTLHPDKSSESIDAGSFFCWLNAEITSLGRFHMRPAVRRSEF
ncbi:hypothetical protein N6H13_08010 [Paenibacillus sp. CC-CFT742]|nr:hypothetical protein [Paenibacillus sp. CC-CFT742]WJH30568.1 hypothetical protein N6H13_08010 [Paenibacillus sp. CC-CFT742]